MGTGTERIGSVEPYLAIDTSTRIGSVALGRGMGALAEVMIGVRAKHAETVLPAIDFVLRSAGLEVSALRGVVVSAGPGSFTGVRIAAATAKGLVRALGVPLFARSGLLTLAAGVGAEGRPVCALFDARRHAVYAACYRFPGYERVETLFEPAVSPVDEVLEQLVGLDPIYAGDGAQRYASQIGDAGGHVAPAHLAWPRASALLWLAELEPEAARVASPSAWEPTYLRPSAAERGVRG